MMELTIALACIASFLVFWAGIVSLIGFMGWKPLATAYPGGREPEGERFTWQSLRIVVGEDGVYLRPMRLFAYNHPPIQIPWEAIRSVEPGLFGRTKLRLDNGRTLALRGRAAKAVRAWWETYPDEATERRPGRDPLLDLDVLDDAPVEEERARSSWRQMRGRS